MTIHFAIACWLYALYEVQGKSFNPTAGGNEKENNILWALTQTKRAQKWQTNAKISTEKYVIFREVRHNNKKI